MGGSLRREARGRLTGGRCCGWRNGRGFMSGDHEGGRELDLD